jgi:hypothetical protein
VDISWLESSDADDWNRVDKDVLGIIILCIDLGRREEEIPTFLTGSDVVKARTANLPAPLVEIKHTCIVKEQSAICEKVVFMKRNEKLYV